MNQEKEIKKLKKRVKALEDEKVQCAFDSMFGDVNEQLEGVTVEPEKEKKFGVYKHSCGSIVWRTGLTKSFGFGYCGGWFNEINTRGMDSDNWSRGTIEEWNNLLIQKAESMGYEDGNYKCLHKPESTCKNTGERFYIEDGDVWNNHVNGSIGNKIFDGKTGEWAEIIIQKLTHSEIEQKIGKFEYIG